MRNVFSSSALGLAHEYISTEQNGLHSYGGSQSAHPDATMRVCGCGVIAGLDAILYLSRHSDCTCPFAAGEDGQSVYNSFASRLRRGFLPLIPGRGINGLMLTGGLELCFLRWRMPYSIHWGARSGSLFENIELMLMRDIPVILAVGPNFPLFWQKNTLSFYCREPDGTLVKSCTARAHYVVATGMDKDWLRISSWGREYYINRGEYTAYGKKHSIPILNSIAVIKPKAR